MLEYRSSRRAMRTCKAVPRRCCMLECVRWLCVRVDLRQQSFSRVQICLFVRQLEIINGFFVLFWAGTITRIRRRISDTCKLNTFLQIRLLWASLRRFQSVLSKRSFGLAALSFYSKISSYHFTLSFAPINAVPLNEITKGYSFWKNHFLWTDKMNWCHLQQYLRF